VSVWLFLSFSILTAILALAGASFLCALAAFLAVLGAGWTLHGQRAERSAWRKTERELKENARQADDIIAAIPSGLIGLDMKGEVCRWNEAATHILGMGRGGIIGQHVDHWPIADQQPLAELLKEALAGRTIRRGSLEVARTDGREIPLGISTSRLGEPGAAGTGVVAIFQDLTEVRRIQTKMKQQERLAAVGTLAASIAHEIRNPLASIAGSVELLSSELDLSGEMGELFGLIIKESDRLNHLISNFLEFTRDREPEFSRFSPTELIRETVRELRMRPEVGEGLSIEVETDSAPDHIDADSDMLRQVFLNMIINACQAMEWKGRISVSAEERDGEDGRCVEFRFRDTGPGIPAQNRGNVFDPFFTTKAAGTGLGLAIAHRFAEIHGGQLELLDGKEKGAEFLFRIPTRAREGRVPMQVVTATDPLPVQ